MLSRKKRNFIFFEAAILTLIIYLIAFFSNALLDKYRESELNNAVLSSQISLGSSLVESMLNNVDCEAAKKSLVLGYKDIKKLGDELTDYGPLIRNDNLTAIKRKEYFLKEAELLIKVMKYNKNCPHIVPVIYFYTPSGSIDKQSLILEQFWLNHKNNTFILPFDYTFSEPVIKYLINYYKVTSTPFVVIGNYTTRDLGENGLVSLNSLTIAYSKLMKDGNYSSDN